MTFNEFNRWVQQHVRDPDMAKILVFLFEMNRALAKEFDEMTKVMLSFASSVQKFQRMSVEDQKRIRDLERRGRNEDDALVESVVLDPKKH